MCEFYGFFGCRNSVILFRGADAASASESPIPPLLFIVNDIAKP